MRGKRERVGKIKRWGRFLMRCIESISLGANGTCIADQIMLNVSSISNQLNSIVLPKNIFQNTVETDCKDSQGAESS